jgi:hypothetical protein
MPIATARTGSARSALSGSSASTLSALAIDDAVAFGAVVETVKAALAAAEAKAA